MAVAAAVLTMLGCGDLPPLEESPSAPLTGSSEGALAAPPVEHPAPRPHRAILRIRPLEPTPAPRDGTGGAVAASQPVGFATTVRSGNGITYRGGHVMSSSTTIYYIWYGNWDGNGAVGILEDFAMSLGSSPYWAINSLYDDQFGGHVSSQIRFGASTYVGYPQGNAVDDPSAVVDTAISQGGVPWDPNGVYVILPSADVGDSYGFCNDYCGYHSGNPSTGLKYAFVGNPEHCRPPEQGGGCYVPSSPNYDLAADSMASHIAHELSESVTDPMLDAWRTVGTDPMAKDVGENADLCAWTFGQTYYSDAIGTQANVRLGNRNFFLQRNWIPVAGGYCGLGYEHEVISVGTNHTLAVQADGSLWSWGRNDKGQLGDGAADRSSPAKINPGAPGAQWISVGAGNRFSVALRSDHTLWAWGDHSKGQIGDGQILSAIQSTPKQVGGAEWQAVRAGDQYVVAIKTDGTLWSWGYDANGQLGVGDQSIHASPTQEATGRAPLWWGRWTQIAAGYAHTLATSADAIPAAWGWNAWGNLGNGDTNQRLVPDWLSPNAPASWFRLSAGYDFSLGVDGNGQLWSWGRNQYGQIGAPSSQAYSAEPGQWISSPLLWESISAGNRHGMAVRMDGTLWTWGSNSNGQLGTGVALGTSFAPPTQESTRATSWVAVYGRQDSSIAARVDGSVWAWGNNGSGQLGLGDTTTRTAPTQLTWTLSPPVVDLTVPELGLSSFRQGVAIALTAGASGGRITKVDFYYNNTLITTDTTAPYATAWNTTNVAPGTYNLRARAWNALGQSTWSAPVTVKIVKVAVSFASSPTSVNLTTDGTIDWLHYGLRDATTVERKNITTHPMSVTYHHEQYVNNFVRDTANAVSINWTDGAPDQRPNPNGSPTTAGVKSALPPFSSDGYDVSADLSTTADRVLSLYLKNVNANVDLKFNVDGAEIATTWTNYNAGTSYRVYRVTFRGADATQSLRGFTSFSALGSGGTLEFLGATLH